MHQNYADNLRIFRAQYFENTNNEIRLAKMVILYLNNVRAIGPRLTSGTASRKSPLN